MLSTVSGETQAVAQLLVEMSELIKGKRLVPLAILSDKPVMLEGFGELAPITKWLPSMPAPMNYFGIWVAKGTPDNVVKTMALVWDKKIKNSEPLKKVRRGAQRAVHADQRRRGREGIVQDGPLHGLALLRRRQGQGQSRYAGDPAALRAALPQPCTSGRGRSRPLSS